MTPDATPTWRRTMRIAIELIVAFAALTGVDLWLTGGTGFAGIQPNPFWLPVLAMAIAYGSAPGVVAAAIASALWLSHVHDNPGERDYLDHLLLQSLPPLLWFIAAIAIGEVTNVRTKRHARLRRRARTAGRNVGRLTESFDRLSQTNRQLQVQIAIEAQTVGHVIDTATRLSAPDPTERREAITHLIALAARTEDFTCYRLVGDDARAWLRGTMAAGRRDALPIALLGRVLRRRGLVHVARRADREALEGVGVAAIGLVDQTSGALVGCLVLHALPFAALNVGRVAELNEIASWLTPLLGETPRAGPRVARLAGLVA